MTIFLKQSTAVVVSFGPAVDKTDGVTLEVGLVSALDHASTGIKLSKNGGALTIRHATVTATTYDAYGMYLVTLDTTDTNTLGRLRMAFEEAATCLPVWEHFTVLAANVYDSLIGGGDVLDVSVTQLLGTAWLAPAVAGTPDVNAKLHGGTAQTGRDIGASVLLSTGTGAGQLDFTSGVVKANLVQILGTALTETAGQIAAAFKQFFDVGTPSGTMKAITAVTTVTNLTNAATAGDLTATMKTSVTTAATAATPTAAAVTGAVDSVTGAVGSVTGAVGSVTGAVGSVTAGVTVTTNNDKTGYALSSAGVQAIWDALTSALSTVGSIGKLLVDNINATISSRSTYAGGDTAGTTTLLGRIVGTLAAGTHNPQTGDAFARLGAPMGVSVSADVAAVKSDSAAILVDTGTTLDGLIQDLPTNAELAASLATADDATLAAIAALSIPTASAVAAQVWDEALAGHSAAGSAGLALSTASSGGVDPSVLADAIWDEVLSGHVTAGTSGKKLTDLVNADLSGVATATALEAVADLVDTEVAAIKVVTDKLDTALELDGAVYRLTANALELAPTGSGGSGTAPTAEEVASQVRTELTIELAHLDADVSSRSAVEPDNASIALILEDSGTTIPATLALLATAASIEALSLTHLGNINAATNAFAYQLSADLGPAMTGKALEVRLRTAGDVAVAFADGTFSKQNGEPGMTILERAGGDYTIRCSQWPFTSMPYTVVLYDAATGFPIPGATVEFNMQDFSDVGGGTGSVIWPYTLTNAEDDMPIVGADVWVTTDEAGENIIAQGVTNDFGIVRFRLDPGTYRVWRSKASWAFENPDTEEVQA